MPTSEFFQTFDPGHPENAAFVHYTRQLRALRSEDVDPILHAVEEFVGTTDDTEQTTVARELGEKINRPHALAASLLRVLEELLRHFAEIGASEDEALAIAADLREAGIITAEDEEGARELLRRLAGLSPQTRVKFETVDMSRGYLPFFLSAQVTTELRAVYTSDRTIEPAAHTAVASVYVDVDRDGQDAYFQIDRPGIQVMIKKLQIAEERLRRLEDLAKALNTSAPGATTKIA